MNQAKRASVRRSFLGTIMAVTVESAPASQVPLVFVRQTLSGLRVVIISADLRWTSASRSNSLEIYYVLPESTSSSLVNSCHLRAPQTRAAFQPRWNFGVISVSGSAIGSSRR